MKRASAIQHSRRLNHALRLLRQAAPAPGAARRLARAHGIGERQAYRYIALAKKQAAPVPVPEARAVFSVKLPGGLVARVRRAARRGSRRGAVSEWVAGALQAALSAKSGHA